MLLRKHLLFAGLIIGSLGSLSLSAQTAVTTPGGTVNNIPFFSDTSILQSSSLVYRNVNGSYNLGVGVGYPQFSLDVSGDINFSGVVRYQGYPLLQANPGLYNYFIAGGGNSTMTGPANIGIGPNALSNTTSGSFNLAVGANALWQNTTGTFNVALGGQALIANTTGGNNTAVGGGALGANTIGENNTAIGAGALTNATTGTSNTAIGHYTFGSLLTGSSNVTIGDNSLTAIDTGDENTAIGDGAGDDSPNSPNVAGNQNIYIGSSAMSGASGNSNETVVGAYAVGNGSNTVTLGNPAVTGTYLQGHIVITDSNTAEGITFADGTTQKTAFTGASSSNTGEQSTGISASNGITNISSPNGNFGFQFAPLIQTIGGAFGEGGSLALQADSVTDPVNTGGFIFLGGAARGDALISKVIIRGNNPAGAPAPTSSGLVVDGFDNVGVGVDPYSDIQAQFHVATPNTPLATDNANFGNSTVLLEGTGARSTISGPTLSFALPALLDGENPWEQARIAATADNLNNYDASGRLYLQTRFLNNGIWDWRNNLVLTSNGNVGVGTTAPAATLDVNGTINTHSISFPDGSSQTTAAGNGVLFDPSNGSGPTNGQGGGSLISWNQLTGGTGETDFHNIQGTGGGGFAFYASTATGLSTPQLFISAGGDVGIGTANPGAPLQIESSALGQIGGNTTPLLILNDQDGFAPTFNNNYLSIFQLRTSSGTDWSTATTRIQQTTDVTTQAYMDFNPPGGQYGIAFGTGGGSGQGEAMRLTTNQNVGIGTTNPASRLEVNGTVTLTANSGAQMIFPDLSVQSTAWNGTTLGGDYAEAIDVLGNREEYEPGDVIAIDESTSGKFIKTNTAYSNMVAGVYSTKPGLLGRRTTSDRSDRADEVPMAMMGIVPTKVSTENGPIKRGDLLVSAGTPGYAMKGTDRDRLIGTVIGKALAPLASGTGLIEVLVSLQ